MQRLRIWWLIWITRWLNKRLPPAEQVTLDRRNIFIFPSRFGWSYLLLVTALFLLGTNYQNNLILALAFLLVSLFVTTIFHTFFNVLGLTIQACPPNAVFLGEAVRFELIIKYNKSRFDFSLIADDGRSEHLIEQTRDSRLGILFTPKQRGIFKVGRIQLVSSYPLGLFRCWTMLALKQQALVYPTPIACPLIFAGGDIGQEGEANEHETLFDGEQEFIGICPYREGESLTKIAWKQVAQGRGWVCKEFSQPQLSLCWLRLADLPADKLEFQLGQLCYQVIELSRSHAVFGLDLGSIVIAPASGLEHKRRCLEALALYEQ